MISCITITRNRHWCLPYSIQQFLAQSYENKELIILDNGSRSCEALVPDLPNVHYYRAASKFTGPLRNEAISYTSGDVIAHWDDDDLHHPAQLTYYRGVLASRGAEIVGADEVLYHDIRSSESWRHRYEDMAHWVHGSTLMYRRKTWERIPFTGHQCEDMYFLRDNIARGIIPVSQYRWPLQVNMMHGENVAPKVTTRKGWRLIDRLPAWTTEDVYREMLDAGKEHVKTDEGVRA